MKNILILIFLFPLCLAAQTKLLSGVVKDKLTNEILPGATVSIDFGDQNVIADENGNFKFLLLADEVILSVKYIGFLPYRKEISLPLTDFEIYLTKVENTLQEVIISGQGSETVKRPILGVNTLNIKSIEKLPAVMGEVDILKGLQVLPGISSVGEASNGVNVRGGTTDQNLFLIDDIPIFNPTHMFGLFSAFPSEAVSGFDLYKGNVPVRYGGRAAAVLDVKLANPSLTKFKMQGGISPVASKIKVDIPIIKDKLAFTASARGSFNDFLFPLISTQLKDIKAKFADGAVKLFYKINSKNTLTASSYSSYDFFQTELLGSVANINSQNTQYKYTTQGFSTKWFNAISKNANIQTTLVSSVFKPTVLLPENQSDNLVSIEQSLALKQLKSSLNIYKEKQNFEIDLDLTHYSINPGVLNPGNSPDLIKVSTKNEQGLEFGIGIEDQITINENLNISAGFRYSHFFNMGPIDITEYNPNEPRNSATAINTTSYKKGQITKSYGGFEPRLGLRVSTGERSSIKVGYNISRQYLQQLSNTTTPIPTSRWKLSDLNIKPQVSSLASIGFFKDSPGNIYEVSAETYYRQTKNIVDYKPGANFLLNQNPETEILQGINKSYGFEFMLSKKKGELTGWANYTYARSLNKINEGPALSQQVNYGNWYAANYDRPHTFNSTLIINGGIHHDISFNLTYSTGRPISSPVGFIRYNNQLLPYYLSRNDSRLPDYHRIDFAWNIYNPKIRNKRFKGNFAFSVYNIYGRKNAYSVFYRTVDGLFSPYKLVIFGSAIPSLSYKFTFE